MNSAQIGWIGKSAGGAAAAALAARVDPAYGSPTKPRASADSCIFIWLGGGACHIDTWDPKAEGDAKAKKPGSYYKSISTAVENVRVCEHLRRMAPLMDRTVVVRSVHHDVIEEHAAAVNRVHTGRPPTGTTVYPSIGSVMSHELGARGDGVPPYVVMGYPSASRGPGFHATIYAAMGVDPAKELYDGVRPVPITDHRRPLKVVLAG